MAILVFNGIEQVSRVQFIVIRSAMRLYLNTGMKANRAFTPANMIAFAAQITGKRYKRTQLREAYLDLCATDGAEPKLKEGD